MEKVIERALSLEEVLNILLGVGEESVSEASEVKNTPPSPSSSRPRRRHDSIVPTFDESPADKVFASLLKEAIKESGFRGIKNPLSGHIHLHVVDGEILHSDEYNTLARIVFSDGVNTEQTGFGVASKSPKDAPNPFRGAKVALKYAMVNGLRAYQQRLEKELSHIIESVGGLASHTDTISVQMRDVNFEGYHTLTPPGL